VNQHVALEFESGCSLQLLTRSLMKKWILSFLFCCVFGIASAEEDGPLLGNEKMPTFDKKEYTQATIRNKLDYPAKVIVAFVDSCATNMMQYMPIHPNQSRPIALTMCSCFIDQFRSDFTIEQFTKGGAKLAQMMSNQYGEVCKQMELTPSTRM